MAGIIKDRVLQDVKPSPDKHNLLLIDSNYLAYQARYVHADLSHKNEKTGILYGFLQRVVTLAKLHRTSDIVFCWDSPRSIRKERYDWYKAKRHSKPMDEDQLIEHQQAMEQFELLREEILPSIGFNNVLTLTGYESDDLFAQIITTPLFPKCRFIIVTADEDLYQLLKDDRVWMYNPSTKEYTCASKFTASYGIPPEDWVKVKSIAGCHTDEIPGVKKGLGEKNAI
jgi:DNA polymerase-1